MFFKHTLTTILTLFMTLTLTVSATADSSKARGFELLEPTLEAHGGLEHWRVYSRFEYRLIGFPLTPQVAEPSHSIVDLRNRFNRIESDGYTVGFNGRQAWAVPGPDAVGLPPRFYSLGSFYFIGMPFVFADPGVILEKGEPATFRGKTHEVLRVRYAGGVGHSDRDDYRLYIDPQTHRLALIDHSVTETGVERVTWTFDEWQRVGGVLVPAAMTFYPGAPADPSTGDGARFTIEKALLSDRAADPALYDPPKDAIVTFGAE